MKINYKINVIVYALIVFTACKQQIATKENSNRSAFKQRVINDIANYYSTRTDSVRKYYCFTDSGEVNSTKLKFFHFYDTRDTGNNKDYWTVGVIAINLTTNNSFIYSAKIKGVIDSVRSRVKGDSFIFFHKEAPKTDSSFFYFEDTFKTNKKIIDPVDLLAERNKGISLKLSALLNDLPKAVKSNLKRTTMDSIIKLFIYTDVYSKYDISEIQHIRLVDSELAAIITSDFKGYSSSNHSLFYKRIQSKTVPLNSFQLRIDYLTRIQKKVKNDNVFVYFDNCDLLFNDRKIMVIINDDLSDNLSSQDFYSIFNQESIMYDVKIYSENL